jgi:hypothetical protein
VTVAERIVAALADGRDAYASALIRGSEDDALREVLHHIADGAAATARDWALRVRSDSVKRALFAVEVLCLFSGPQALRKLVSFAASRGPVSEAALQALGRLPDSSWVGEALATISRKSGTPSELGALVGPRLEPEHVESLRSEVERQNKARSADVAAELLERYADSTADPELRKWALAKVSEPHPQVVFLRVARVLSAYPDADCEIALLDLPWGANDVPPPPQIVAARLRQLRRGCAPTRQLFDCSYPEMQSAVVEALAACPAGDEDATALLQALAVEEIWPDVRQRAIELVADRPHPASQRTVFAGLFEPVDAPTVERLLGTPDDHAALARRSAAEWSGKRRDLAAFSDLARSRARDLLGGPIDLFPTTEAPWVAVRVPRDEPAPVGIDPALLLEADLDVALGVLVHELGHHEYDFRQRGFLAGQGVAASQGASSTFAMLLDERLERKLRSARPEWTRDLDRAGAYLRQAPPSEVPTGEYAAAVGLDDQDLIDKVVAGALPGDVAEGGRTVRIASHDVVSIPALLPPLAAFFLGLLAIRDGERFADESVRRALRLVPRDLKDMPHGRLARLAIQIVEVLGVQDEAKTWDRFVQARRRFPRLLGGGGRMLERAGAARGGASRGSSPTPGGAGWPSGVPCPSSAKRRCRTCPRRARPAW